QAVAQNAAAGLPVMRPLFLHYENDAATYTLKYQYLLGQDLLVAPVHEQGRCDWTLYLPEDHWVNIWTGEVHQGGEITVYAPIGKPPVFYRAKSEWASLFASLRNI
ncbi:alpha-glucosidase, partial [Salmonella enterica subsp. enterica serovar Weltevreden]